MVISKTMKTLFAFLNLDKKSHFLPWDLYNLMKSKKLQGNISDAIYLFIYLFIKSKKEFINWENKSTIKQHHFLHQNRHYHIDHLGDQVEETVVLQPLRITNLVLRMRKNIKLIHVNK